MGLSNKLVKTDYEGKKTDFEKKTLNEKSPDMYLGKKDHPDTLVLEV